MAVRRRRKVGEPGLDILAERMLLMVLCVCKVEENDNCFQPFDKS